MIEELITSSGLLQEALNRYLRACVTIRKSCVTINGTKGFPRELSSRVAHEVDLLATYNSTLQQAKSAIGYARNSPPLAVINSLPAEILARIFGFVVATESFIPEKPPMTPPPSRVFPKYPDLLLRVCSYWRDVVYGSRGLWAHIDLSFDFALSPRLLPRAHVYAARANQSQLCIYLEVASKLPSLKDSARVISTIQFIASVAARTRTLVLDSGGCLCDELLVMALETFLQNCTPGKFTQLIVPHCEFTDLSGSNKSIRAEERNPGTEPDYIQDKNIHLDLSTQRLEDIILHLTTLRLNGLFFPWTSNAYKGLVDLSLTSQEVSREILVSDLVNILKASPGLRRLEVGLTIVGTLPRNAAVEPMPFKELEVLNSTVKHGAEFGSLLQWIAPGPKPLGLSLARNYWTSSSAQDELIKDHRLAQFFSRSNIPVITAPRLHGINQVTDLLGAAPNIQTLVLKRFLSDQNQDYRNLPTSTTSLGSLYILQSKIYIKDLFHLVRIHRVRNVVLWSCEDPKSRERYGPEHDITSKLREALSIHCPTLADTQISYSKVPWLD